MFLLGTSVHPLWVMGEGESNKYECLQVSAYATSGKQRKPCGWDDRTDPPDFMWHKVHGEGSWVDERTLKTYVHLKPQEMNLLGKGVFAI